MESAERVQFIEFLCGRGVLSHEQGEAMELATRHFREAVASVAIRHQLIEPARLEELLDCDGGGFLDEAVRRGALDAQSASRLAVIEGLREIFDVIEAAILEGVAPPDSLLRELGAFLARHDDV